MRVTTSKRTYLAEKANAMDRRLLDLRDVMLSQPDYERLMCADGIHPNDAGHVKIAEKLMGFLKSL